ncbi:RNA polymerase sigma-70 factor [bacterium]|nr:RNA polymerase sigma-70 factor [bacterium]
MSHNSQNTDHTTLAELSSKTAFEELFRSMYSRLCAYAYQYLKSSEEAEELVQDVFFMLWEKRHSIQIDSSVSAYLFSTVRNRSLNVLSHLKVVARHEQEAVQHADLETQGGYEQEELGQLIALAVDKLPIERRKVFYMSKYEGKKYLEIAEELGISVKTVENQMGKALKFLRQELAELVSLILLILFYN